uniref:uncharacterized protein LOC118147722 isoform X2 n=1 Tax=Callithrix jacchus TaxID=9483 RepID=UPI00159E6CDD|nr:uncharacterized protein LOC118147722 isoform X2 [Callithrix jacchus]
MREEVPPDRGKGQRARRRQNRSPKHFRLRAGSAPAVLSPPPEVSWLLEVKLSVIRPGLCSVSQWLLGHTNGVCGWLRSARGGNR